MNVDHKMESTSYLHFEVTIDLGRDYFEPIIKTLYYIYYISLLGWDIHWLCQN